jgi:SulP family sulfate permease
MSPRSLRSRRPATPRNRHRAGVRRMSRWVLFRKASLRQDAVAGLVLGVQSVPDGLATGLLAGVNPLSGLYAYMVGTISGAVVTSSAFMAIQGTGAMAMIVVDVPVVHDSGDPARALFTLSMLTGVVMLAAGLFRLGSVLRFVSNAVMVGFINAVGVNIILGQLANFTGYAADGPNRVVRAFNTLIHPGQLQWATVAVGAATIVLILALERTRVGPVGLVLAVMLTSAAAAVFGWNGVATLNDLGVVPSSLPRPEAPMLVLIPSLLIPAVSLAFVGLVQGASISAAYPNPDGRSPDVSRDFVGQGVANIAAGVFQGMPVGGSVSASALNKEAGARSRQSLVFAGVVMAIVIVAFGGVVGYVAMPALAGLLMLIGYRTIKPADLRSVWRTGAVQKAVLVVTFALTMIIPLQYAVLVGVGLSVILYVVRQSNQITVRRRQYDRDGHLVETDPPALLPANEVVVLQPYGSLFFAAAPVFEALLPVAAETSRHSVVILRLRGRSDLGSTVMDVLRHYATALAEVDSRLVIVSTNERIDRQLASSGIADLVGPDGIYRGDERVGAALQRAQADAAAWIAAQQKDNGEGPI